MPKPTNAVALEIMKATGAKYKAKEDPADFRLRLVRAGGDPDFKGFDDLSEDAQQWINDGIEAHNDEKPVADFPEPKVKKTKKGKKEEDTDESEEDESEEQEEASEEEGDSKEEETEEESDDEDESEEDESEEDDSEEDEEQPEKPKKGKQPKDKTMKTKTKSTKTEKSRSKKSKRSGRGGAVAYLRELICKYPQKSKAAILAMVEKKGYEVGENTLTVTYYSTAATIKCLAALGVVNKSQIPAGGRAKKAKAKEEDDE